MAQLQTVETIFSKLNTLEKEDGQLIVSRDNEELYFDLNGERICITDWVAIDDESTLLALLTPLANKFYYVKSTATIWRYVDSDWICLNKGSNIDDALSTTSTNAVQNKVVTEALDKKGLIKITYSDFKENEEYYRGSDKTYWIIDEEGGVSEAKYIKYTPASGLSSTNVQDAIDEVNDKIVTSSTEPTQASGCCWLKEY